MCSLQINRGGWLWFEPSQQSNTMWLLGPFLPALRGEEKKKDKSKAMWGKIRRVYLDNRK